MGKGLIHDGLSRIELEEIDSMLSKATVFQLKTINEKLVRNLILKIPEDLR